MNLEDVKKKYNIFGVDDNEKALLTSLYRLENDIDVNLFYDENGTVVHRDEPSEYQVLRNRFNVRNKRGDSLY